MKAKNKISILVVLAFMSWIVFTGLIQYNQNALTNTSAVSLLSDGDNKTPRDSGKYIYVGMEKCASVCHNNKDMGFQYDIVRSSPHANAFKILGSRKAALYAKKADIRANPDISLICLKCHETGAGLDSSFFSVTYRKEDGVTCEACHKGPYIAKTYLPKEADCLKCHNNSVHRMNKFNFKLNCKKIAHQRPGTKTL